MHRSPPDLDPIGPFRITRILGEGAIGRVYDAVHEPSGTPVALKVVRPGSPQRRGPSLLHREVRALAALHHPGIVAVLDYGETDDGRAWIAMQRADGVLDDLAPPGSWPDVQRHLFAILDALSHAHARGVVHRDLKPANLLAMQGAAGPRVLVADFGIAWRRGEADRFRLAGTPGYMAPEQRGGGVPIGPWTDLYALACLTWEWVTGGRYEADADFEPAFDVPEKLRHWLDTLLDPDPARRCDHAAVAAATLLKTSRGDGATTFAWSTQGLQLMSVTGRGLLPVPESWRPPLALPPPPRAGPALPLLPLRSLPLWGREGVRDHLWAALGRVERDERPEVIALVGRPGAGRWAVATWLGERAVELGCATVLHTDAASEDLDVAEQLRRLEEASARGPVVWLVRHPDAGLEVRTVADALLASRKQLSVLLVAVIEGSDPLAEDILRIEVPGLRRGHLATHLQQTLGLAPSLASQVADSAGGLPGLAVARVRRWLGAGTLVDGPDGLRRSGEIDRARAEVLLEGLSAPARRALRLAAVIGPRVARQELVGAASRLGPPRVEEQLEPALRIGLLHELPGGWGWADDDERRSVLAGLFPDEAARIHATCAEVLREARPGSSERVQLVGHLVAAGRLAEAARIATPEAAASLNAQQPLRAHTLLDVASAALAEVPASDPRHGEVLRLRAAAWVVASDLVRARLAVEELEASATAHGFTDPRVWISAAQVWEHLGDLGRAHRALAHAVQDMEAFAPPVLASVGRLHWIEGRHDEALRYYQLALDAAAEPGWEMSTLSILNGLGCLAVLRGDLDVAEGHFRRVASLSRKYAFDPYHGRVNLAGIRYARGDYASAHVEARGMLDEAEARGLTQRLRSVTGMLLLTSFRTGDRATFDAIAGRMDAVLRVGSAEDEGLARDLLAAGDDATDPAQAAVLWRYGRAVCPPGGPLQELSSRSPRR